MIYRTLCIFLRWYLRIFYPKAMVVRAGILPFDKPCILVCNSKNAFQGALFLAAHMPFPLAFIKKHDRPLNPFSKLVFKALHIIPLLSLDTRIDRNQKPGNVWKDLRELIADNCPLVFFADHEQEEVKISKGAVKLAFHTESVFDFHLNVEIIPLSISYTDQKEVHIYFSEGIPIADYEMKYKQHPARTIRSMSQHLKVLLSQPVHLRVQKEQPHEQMVS